jgi:hypothetical protein
MAGLEKMASSIFSGITGKAKWRLCHVRLGLLGAVADFSRVPPRLGRRVGAATQGLKEHGRVAHWPRARVGRRHGWRREEREGQGEDRETRGVDKVGVGPSRQPLIL